MDINISKPACSTKHKSITQQELAYFRARISNLKDGALLAYSVLQTLVLLIPS